MAPRSPHASDLPSPSSGQPEGSSSRLPWTGCFVSVLLVLACLIVAPGIQTPSILGQRLWILLIFGGLTLAFLAINGVVDPLLLRNARRRAERQGAELAAAWADLAERGGLTFHPEGVVVPRGGYAPRAGLGGKCRGRLVLIGLAAFASADEPTPLSVYAVIRLKVHNPGGRSLQIREKDSATRGFAASSRPGFDRWFRVKGQPESFVNQAVDMIVRHPSYMLGKAPRLIMLDHPDYAGLLTAKWRRPRIELKGTSLLCYQHGILAEADQQLDLLNLLCELADLVEGTRT